MTLEEARIHLEQLKKDLSGDAFLYGDFDKKVAIDTVLKALQEYEKQIDLDYVRENYIAKEKVRKMIEDCRGRRNQLADGHFWENSWNVNEDTALVVAETALEELLKE